MKIHFIDEFPKIKPQYIVFSKFWLFVFCIKPVDNLWISRQIAYFWKKIQKHDHNILCLLNFGYLCSVDNLNSYPQVIHRLSTGKTRLIHRLSTGYPQAFCKDFY